MRCRRNEKNGLYFGVPADFVARLDDLVVERLMVALCMIMRQELPNSVAKHVFPEENQSRKALVLYASDESFDVWVQIRRPWRQFHDFHTLTFEYLSESIGEFWWCRPGSFPPTPMDKLTEQQISTIKDAASKLTGAKRDIVTRFSTSQRGLKMLPSRLWITVYGFYQTQPSFSSTST